MLPNLSPLLFLGLPLLIHSAISFVIYPDAAVFNTPEAPHHLSSGSSSDASTTPLPVLVWHGLGDSADADGMTSVAELLTTVHPGTYVHIISLAADGGADRSSSFFGNVTEQIAQVCDTIKNDTILSSAPALDALGFSQGGQFLRGLVERCESAPPVRSLITFGAQHNGIAQFQKCADVGDWLCRGAEAMIKGGGVWANFIQKLIVPAQYFRDPEDLDNYLAHSGFLADVNNEHVRKNAIYKERLAALDHFVMVMFADDETVLPKESSWWAEVNGTTGVVTPLKDRDIYLEDWLGLKELDEKGGLVFEMVDGGHMQLNEVDMTRLFAEYFGPIKGKGKGKGSNWAEEL